jgi:hypothetical protein
MLGKAGAEVTGARSRGRWPIRSRAVTDPHFSGHESKAADVDDRMRSAAQSGAGSIFDAAVILLLQ